jgi:hypothetical protein
LIRETTENESANEGYRFGQEEETYNIVAAHGYFGRLIFQQKEKRRDEDQSPFSWLQLLSLRFLRSRINSVQKKRSFHRKLPVLARRLYQEGECLDLSKQLK